MGRNINLRKLVVAVCSGGRGAEGSTVETMWGAWGARICLLMRPEDDLRAESGPVVLLG